MTVRKEIEQNEWSETKVKTESKLKQEKQQVVAKHSNCIVFLITLIKPFEKPIMRKLDNKKRSLAFCERYVVLLGWSNPWI